MVIPYCDSLPVEHDARRSIIGIAVRIRPCGSATEADAGMQRTVVGTAGRSGSGADGGGDQKSRVEAGRWRRSIIFGMAIVNRTIRNCCRATSVQDSVPIAKEHLLLREWRPVAIRLMPQMS